MAPLKQPAEIALDSGNKKYARADAVAKEKSCSFTRARLRGPGSRRRATALAARPLKWRGRTGKRKAKHGARATSIPNSSCRP
eukprot:4359329-Pyramimonas_sp.AAC.1